jgi:endonuclease III
MSDLSEHGRSTSPVGQKGYSGNPGGRPKMPEELKKAFQEQTQNALDTLVDVMGTGKGSERVKAAEVILDRAWGKPVQAVDANVNDGRIKVDTSKLTPEQRDAITALAIANMAISEAEPED